MPATTTTPVVPVNAATIPVFRRYLGARAVAIFGNALSLVAMPLLAYRLTGSAALTALVASAAFWPYLVFGLLAGALADRLDRRRLMVGAGLVSAAVLATVPVASQLGLLTYAHLLVAELCVASLFVFADAAAFGVLPLLVGRGGLASATAALTIAANVIMLICPAIAGILVSLVDPALVIALTAVAHVVVAWFIATLRWNTSDVPPRTGERSVRSDIAEGLRFIWNHEVLRWLTIFGFGASLALGGVSGLLIVVGIEQLGLAQDAPQLGWLFAAHAFGTLIGSSLLPMLQRRWGIGRITSVGLALSFVLLMALSTVDDLWGAIIGIIAFQIPLMALILNAMVARSVVTPDAFQARVNTTGRMIAGGGGPFGTVIAGLVADAAGTEWALRVVGVGLLVSLIGVLRVGVHRYPHVRELIAVS